ncbi:hypothetical protein [Terrabacter sp. 2YAF2]|uniref:hypothetical protein n=1 Tax=Terrabacter sp. 2YAF2 TaxID=3233026 RepID=UPI003F9D2A72
MSTTTPDLFTSLRTGWTDAVQQWMDSSQTLWDDLAASFTTAGTPGAGMPWAGTRTTRPARDRHDRHHHHHDHHDHHEGDHHCDHEDHHHHDHDHRHDHGCGCGESSCGCHGACDCCEPDADVVVHTRVGERRILPLNLHNPWRRERDVNLEVGPWHVCCGDGVTVVAVLEEEQLTLQPCEDRVVRLVVGVTPTADNGTGDTGGTGDVPGTQEGPGRVQLPHDVAACSSAYADVRFEGAARPLRVAVVVSPAGCDPVEVGSDCGCCS